MNLYLDLKYLSLISNRLPLFKKKSDTLWNCRCTICGDSSTNKSKARGYFYVKNNSLFYKCHNCDAGMAFFTFLKNTDGILYKEYCLEKFKDESARNPVEKPSKKSVVKHEVTTPKAQKVAENSNSRLIDHIMDRLDGLDDNHEAVQFCLSRKIPREKFKELYYVDDAKKLEQLSSKYKDKILGREPRLVLPFFDWKGQFAGFTARDILGKSGLRYVQLKVKEDVPLIFGTETANPKKPMYVVEGPIDSLFIDNCIAVCGTAFTKLDELNVDKNNLTVIVDNQPRNREVCKVYSTFIDKGYKIVIWPQTLEEKDINDIILSGISKEKLMQIINRNTYQGLAAKAAFLAWKRV